MIIIDKYVIDEDIIKEHFACNLNLCKGACCVAEGERGAPLTEEETLLLERLYPKIKPYLDKKGIEAIEKKNQYYIERDSQYETPVINNQACVYAVFENGIALCGIEKAYREKTIDFIKPLSCHLYPIRVSDKPPFIYLQYERWEICGAACKNGVKKDIRVFEFVQDAIIRAFGAELYHALRELALQQALTGK